MMHQDEIVRTYGPMVWQLVYRIVGGTRREADVADCFQEVFVAALEVERTEGVRNWEALLKRFAVVKGIDRLRRRARERGREAREPEWEALPARGRDVGAALEEAELIERLRAHLGALPEPQSTALMLRYLGGMSYEEIAAEMGLTANAVGVLLSRAKSRLDELMEDKTLERHGEP
jgi:RNA polymerase sigma-70 factor, ECF subfamily